MAQDSSLDRCQVAIIGAGAAGLHAAYCLLERQVTDIVLLEASDRVGGRIHSILVNGSWLELGAQWIHGQGNNPLWTFCQQHKLRFSPTANPDGEGRFIRNDGQEIPADVLAETQAFLDQVHDECNQFANYKPLEAPASVGHYFRDRFEQWLLSCKKDDDAETRDWRRQFFEWFIKWEECDAGCDDLYRHSSISWGEYLDFNSDTSFMDGFQSYLNIYLNKLKRNRIPIRLGSIVQKIRWQEPDHPDGGVLVEYSGGGRLMAKAVLVTVSLGYLKEHHVDLFDPGLPKPMVRAIENISFGTIDRIKLEFEKPFWSDSNPGIMFLWQHPGPTDFDKDSWVRAIYGLDMILGHANMLMGWISGRAARFMETLPDDVIGRDICAHLQEVLRKHQGDANYQLPKLKRVIVTRWHQHPFIRGVYSYRNQDTDLQGISNQDLGQPLCFNGVPRVLFAGEATHSQFYGTVHGAIHSAEREVQRLMQDPSSSLKPSQSFAYRNGVAEVPDVAEQLISSYNE